MSLIVYAYKRDPASGKMSDLEAKPTPPRNDLAGPEVWRQSIYGSAKKLGLRFLPTLAEGYDIYAEGADLDLLRSEAETMLANLEVISPEDPLGVRFRIENILEAIRLAKEVADGGVYVG